MRSRVVPGTLAMLAILAVLAVACGAPSSAPSPSSAAPTAIAVADASGPVNGAATDSGPIASSPPCSADGWCWDEPVPQGNALHGVWAASATDAWAVGEHGVVLHFDGSAWRSVRAATTARLRVVDGTSPRPFFIAGEPGVLRWETDAFRPLPFPPQTGGIVFALVVRGGEAWAGVEAGGLLHESGGRLEPIALPTRGRVTALAVAPDGALYVGVDNSVGGALAGPTLLRVRGANVETLPPPPVSQTITGLVVAPSGELVAAFGNRPAIFVQRAGAWQKAALPSSDAVGALRIAPDGTWWLAMRGLYRGDGTRFELVSSKTPALYGLALGGSTVFAVGEAGAMVRWDGARAIETATSAPREIEAITDDHAGATLLLTRGGELARLEGAAFGAGAGKAPDGSSTRSIAAFGKSVFAIASFMRTDGFSPSHSQILRWTGSAWERSFDAPGIALTAIAASAPDVLWAVGNESRGVPMQRTPAAVVLRFDGRSFRKIPVPPDMTEAFDVRAPSKDDVWIVGGSAAARWNGKAFVSVPLPPGMTTLRSVSVVAADSVWLLGERALARWNGTAVVREAVPYQDDGRHFSRVDATADVVTIAGTGGLLLRRDASGWHVDDAGVGVDLVAVGHAGRRVFVAPQTGGLLHRDP